MPSISEKWPNLYGGHFSGTAPIGKEEVRAGEAWQVQQLLGDCGFRWAGWLPKDEVANHDAVREILEAHGETCPEHHRNRSAVWHLTECSICARARAAA